MSVVACAADKVVQLPEPNLNRTTTTVMKALTDRHSTREYADRSLSMQDLSDLLWAANGINRKDSGKRTAPSAMNKQDVDVYVILPEGTYLYDATQNQLTLVAEGDYRSAAAAKQDFVKTAPVVLLLVCDVSRSGDISKVRHQLTSAMDAGIVSQNISIFCASAGLATVPRGWMDTAQLKQALKLTDGQMPALNHPVGYFK